MNPEPNQLEKILATIAGGVIGLEYFLCYNNYDGLHIGAEKTVRWLPIEESYFGDTPEIFTAIVASGFIANTIENYGQKEQSTAIETLGRYFPTLTALAVGTYYTLGESIAPYLLPGTADTKDIASVVITTIASPFVANYVRKAWRSMWKSRVSQAIEEINA